VELCEGVLAVGFEWKVNEVARRADVQDASCWERLHGSGT
jgi:hypothetical protein